MENVYMNTKNIKINGRTLQLLEYVPEYYCYIADIANKHLSQIRQLELVRKALDLAKAESVDEELTKAVYIYKLSPEVLANKAT